MWAALDSNGGAKSTVLLSRGWGQFLGLQVHLEKQKEPGGPNWNFTMVVAGWVKCGLDPFPQCRLSSKF